MIQQIRSRFALVAVLVIGCLLSNSRSAAAWQDDPFGSDEPTVQDTADRAVVDNTAESGLGQSLSGGVKLIIRSVRESNPKTAIDLARAIKSMLDIEQFSEARRYLDQLIDSKPDGPQLFELSQVTGLDFLLDLRSQAQLQPAGSEFVELVLRTAKLQAYDPQRIADLVADVADDNRFVRQEAFRKLRLLGAPAAAEMLNVCDDRNRRMEIPFVQAALRQMGKPALLPLIGAIRADGTRAQAVAVSALANIKSELATDALLRTSLSANVPPTVRTAAAGAIARRGLISQYDIERRIFERANAYLAGTINIPIGNNGQSEIWNWSFSDSKLIPTIVTAENASRIMAVDLARDVYRLRPENMDYRQLQLLAVLEATKRVIGPNRFVLLDEVAPFVSNLNASELNQALRVAIERNLLPAAIAAAELAGQIGDLSLLLTGDGENSELVKAILTGHRELQYAAAKAIARIDPKQAFPGCSYVAKIIAMMANSSGRSAGIVVHPHPETAQSLASAIYQSGSVGIAANSGVELFDRLKSNPDINFILIADALSRPHYQEVVQQIRSYWLSQNLPVGLLVRDSIRQRQAKQVLSNDPLTLVMPLSVNSKFVNGQIIRLNHLRPLQEISDTQRDLHAKFALQWLSKSLAESETYQFYELNQYRDQLVLLFNNLGNYELKCEILSNLGTADSQQILLQFANDSSQSIEKRKLAADAFVNSVDRGGIQLLRAEIQNQYDRFDSIGGQTAESLEITGSILAAIESKTSVKSRSLTDVSGD